jgi:DNA (cytosine-5)-methyltransferase 1
VTAPTARPAAPPTGKPVLLDAYSGAGGAARGYQLAGFHVVGVDVAPQPRYAGDEFYVGDAIEFIRRHGRAFDAIHASPPCQAHTKCRALWGRTYADLIPQTRAALVGSGRPYVVENVEDAPLLSPIVLCGTMFGLKVYRHRKFESSVFLMAPPHPKRHPVKMPRANTPGPDGYICVAGHFSPLAVGRAAMGIPWMGRDELSQAIPPAYSEFVGRQLLRALGVTL